MKSLHVIAFVVGVSFVWSTVRAQVSVDEAYRRLAERQAQRADVSATVAPTTMPATQAANAPAKRSEVAPLKRPTWLTPVGGLPTGFRWGTTWSEDVDRKSEPRIFATQSEAGAPYLGTWISVSVFVGPASGQSPFASAMASAEWGEFQGQRALWRIGGVDGEWHYMTSFVTDGSDPRVPARCRIAIDIYGANRGAIDAFARTLAQMSFAAHTAQPRMTLRHDPSGFLDDRQKPKDIPLQDQLLWPRA